jgi:hypothetical protein
MRLLVCGCIKHSSFIGAGGSSFLLYFAYFVLLTYWQWNLGVSDVQDNGGGQFSATYLSAHCRFARIGTAQTKTSQDLIESWDVR